jgi:hypothetical protein
MDTNQLLAEIDAEIARLEEVKRLLKGTETGVVRRGRKPKGTMSAAGRARIAAAQRKRWKARGVEGAKG